MNKFIFLLIFSLLSAGINAQIIKKQVIKQPLQAPASGPTTTPPPPPPSSALTAADYFLTSVKVTVQTGDDNKEFPSYTFFRACLKGISNNYFRGEGLFILNNMQNEFPVQSTTSLGLNKLASDASKLSLAEALKNGLTFEISYLPNFFLDAWKITNITWTIEFRDRNGNLHPSYGTRILSFPNSTGRLDNRFQIFRCLTDERLNPLTAMVSEK